MIVFASWSTVSAQIKNFHNNIFVLGNANTVLNEINFQCRTAVDDELVFIAGDKKVEAEFLIKNGTTIVRGGRFSSIKEGEVYKLKLPFLIKDNPRYKVEITFSTCKTPEKVTGSYSMLITLTKIDNHG